MLKPYFVKPDNLEDLKTLPFFEYRRCDQEQVGAAFQLYKIPIRKQINDHILNGRRCGALFYMCCTKFDTTGDIPDIVYEMKQWGWTQEKINNHKDIILEEKGN